MTCDEVRMALHCGEAVKPHCAECEKERAFVEMVERGLAQIRPARPIAPWIRARIRRRSWGPWAVAAAVVLSVVAMIFALRRTPEPVPTPKPVRESEEIVGPANVQIRGVELRLEKGARANVVKRDVLTITLVQGEASIDAPASAKFELQLGFVARPVATSGRFAARFRPGEIVVEEGTAQVGDVLVEKGQDYALWDPGEVVYLHGEGMKATRVRDGVYAYGISFYSKKLDLFRARPGQVIRFRYLAKGPFLFQTQNVTRNNNYEIRIDEPGIGSWTTVTIRVMDLPPNPGAQTGPVREGDVFSSMTWWSDSELQIRDLRVSPP